MPCGSPRASAWWSAGTRSPPARGCCAWCVPRRSGWWRPAPPAGPNHFPGRIGAAVFLGGRYDCEVTLAGDVTLRAEVAAGAASPAPSPGEPTVVVLDPADVVVLGD